MRKNRVVGFAIAGILLAGTIAEAQSATTQPRPRRRHVRGVRLIAEVASGMVRFAASRSVMPRRRG